MKLRDNKHQLIKGSETWKVKNLIMLLLRQQYVTEIDTKLVCSKQASETLEALIPTKY